MPRQNNIQFRKGTGSEWTSANSVLASGEPGYEIDTGKFKIGYGGSEWNNLYYTAIHPTGFLAGSNIGVALGTNGSSATISVTGTVNQAEQSQSLVTTVFNETGASIAKMTAVYINGGHGDRPTIQKAIATGDTTSAGTYGLTYEAIGINQTGQVIVFGSLTGLNTDQFNPNAPQGNVNGVTLYLSPTTSGALTTTKPYAPNHIVAIGTITRTHQNQGVIEVRVQNGFELEELHNVAVTGATNGQFLQYDSGSGLWVPSSSGNFSSLRINNNSIVTGTGLTNYILKWSSNSGVSNSNVYDDGSQAIRFGYNNAGYVYISDDWAGGELGLVTSGQQSIAINYPSDGSFRYGGGPVGGENIVVASGGNVGIGTDAPTEKLTVNGNSNFIGNIFVGSISGSDPLYIQSSTASIIFNDMTIFPQNDIDTSSNIRLSVQTADTLLITDVNKNIVSLNSPSLTEIGYVSGVSSNIQTQLDSKQNILTNPVTGTGLANHIAYWNSSSGIVVDSGQLYWNATNNRLGIGTSSPSVSVDVVGSGNFSGDLTVGGNLVINGSTITANVDTITIEDPIITLGLTSGNIVTNDTLDRGLALVRATGLTAFMGWDSSASEFVMLSSGVASNNSGNYNAGTYGDLRINNLVANSGNFNILSINNTNVVTGTGIINHIAYWNSSSGIAADSGQLYWDSANNRLGIGSSVPSGSLDVNGLICARDGINNIFESPTDFSGPFGNINWYNSWENNGNIASISVYTNGTPADGDLVFSTKNSTSLTEKLRIKSDGKVGIGTSSPTYKLEVDGSFGATTKSFKIKHPSKSNHSLEYGSLESPYHGVRLTGRGKLIKGVGFVELPDYLKDLIHDDESIVIQLTNYKHGKTLYIDKIDLQNDRFIVKADRAKTLGELEFFWTLSGVRKDVDHLVVEKRN